MAELLRLMNFSPFNIVEQSRLSEDAAAGQDELTPENADQLSDGAYVVIGEPGTEQAEIGQIDDVTDGVVSLTAVMSFAHKRFEPVVKLRGNQIRVYRAANVDGTAPASASFSLIATVTIQADQQYTEYVDADGGSGYWYRQTLYDGSSETEIDDSVPVRGGDYGHYATIDSVRIEAGFTNNAYVTDQQISDRRDDAEAQVNSALYSAGYPLPLATPYPTLLTNITKLFAAGYLLLQEYGEKDEGTNKEGKAKLKLAQDMLDKIVNGTMLLIGADGTPVSKESQRLGLTMWPDASTEDTDPSEGGSRRAFRMGQVF